MIIIVSAISFKVMYVLRQIKIMLCYVIYWKFYCQIVQKCAASVRYQNQTRLWKSRVRVSP